MSERIQVPVKVSDDGRGSTIETHPSFGLVSISRYSCAPAQNLFGSSIRHNSGVSLSISKAELRRDLSNNWYHPKEEIVEINMSEAQWAELVSHFNVGPGVPCTLNHVNHHATSSYSDISVPVCPAINERQQIEKEFKKEMYALTQGMRDLVAKAALLQAKPSINKQDRKEFVEIANTLECKITNCLPFIHSQFNEAMDGVVVSAKADMEAFVSQLLRQAGIEAIRDQVVQAGENVAKQVTDAKPVV